MLARNTALTGTVNWRNSYFARRKYGEMHDAINTRLAAALGAGADEIARMQELLSDMSSGK